jgi:hypothetical protein
MNRDRRIYGFGYVRLHRIRIPRPDGGLALGCPKVKPHIVPKSAA